MSVIVSNYCFVFEKFGCCVSNLIFGFSSQVNILSPIFILWDAGLKHSTPNKYTLYKSTEKSTKIKVEGFILNAVRTNCSTIGSAKMLVIFMKKDFVWLFESDVM